MSKFKVGDRVRLKEGWYAGYTAGSPYNLPSTPMTVVDADKGFLILDNTAVGKFTPAVNPDGFELVVEGPVRTVTRKEIVPGVYDRIEVTSHGSKSVRLRLASRGGPVAESVVHVLSVQELRTAIDTLTAIRDALDEVAA